MRVVLYREILLHQLLQIIDGAILQGNRAIEAFE
jgi:hypothetical protein